MVELIKSKPLIILIVVASSLINYLLIDKTQEQAAKNATQQVHTPQEWLQLYTCNESEQKLTHSPINTPFPSKCRRDPAAWRYKYIEEHGSGDLLIREKSIDERLANVIYTTTTTKWTNTDQFKFNSGSWRQDEANKAALAGGQVDNDKCQRHLTQMFSLIEELEFEMIQRRINNANIQRNLEEGHIKLARVLDSFGRYESGFLVSGKAHSIGSYDHCTRGQLLFNSKTAAGLADEEIVKTRFCWARLKADEHLDESLKARKKSNFDDQDNSILTGICIPETCHSLSFRKNKQLLQRIVDNQFKLPKSMYINETLELESIFCLPDEGSGFSMPLAGKLLLIALVGWICLVLYATLRHKSDLNSNSNSNSNLDEQPQKWIKALDLIESWRDFVELNRGPSSGGQIGPKPPVELETLNGIKVILCQSVVIGHSLLVSWTYSSDRLEASQLWDRADLVAGAAMQATFSPDAFFVLTGLIVSYSSFKALTKRLISTSDKDWKQRAKCLVSFCLSFARNRYLRLVPMFVLFHWLKKFVFLYVGWGPLWDYGLNRDTSNGACRLEESWLVPFTFWSAFLPLTKQCLLQSWSISNDIFFSLLMGPLMVAMYFMQLKRALWATLVISSMPFVAYNWQLAFKTTCGLHYELQDIGKMVEMRYMTIASHLYTQPIYRLASVSFGLVGGFYLFKLQANQMNNDQGARFTRTLRGPLSIFAYLVVGLPFLVKISLPFIRQLIEPYQSLIQFMMPLLRALWAIGIVLIFVRWATDWKDTKLVRLLSGKVWKVASKLNYLILLIHYDLLMVHYYLFATNTVKHSNWLVLAIGSYIYLLTIPLSGLVHVVFENPINKLARAYI